MDAETTMQTAYQWGWDAWEQVPLTADECDTVIDAMDSMRCSVYGDFLSHGVRSRR